MPNWLKITHRGQDLRIAVTDSANEAYQVGCRYGSNDGRGHVVLLDDKEVIVHRRPSDPHSVGVSDHGDVVFADWIKYGESTGANITLFEKSDTNLYTLQIDASSPLVDIHPAGSLIAVCPYDEPLLIIDIEHDERLVRHPYDFADRLVPTLIETSTGPQVELANSNNADPLYRIDLDGNITWHSSEFETQQYYEVLSIDHTVSWGPLIEKCAADYSESDDEQVRSLITNKIGEARLVDASPQLLREVVDVLERYRSTFTGKPAHSRLISQTLGNAYYRLAKEHGRDTSAPDAFWEYIEKAGEEYQNVLPWYNGKEGLAKVLRLQANQYHKQQRQREALACYEQLTSLEEKFDVELRSNGDINRMEDYTERGLEPKEPNETGKLLTELYMY